MHHTSRRDFLKSGMAAAILGTTGLKPARAAARRAATDWVTLGRTGVKVTRLAFGTGTYGGRVQRELGQEQFTRLVRHAYDNGVRFFETAESYRGMPEMLGIALKGLPRDSYRLMHKFSPRPVDDARAVIDGFRKQLDTDYFDILLIHCVRSPTWPEDWKKLRDEFSQAKEKKILVAHGASVHGLPALRAFPGNNWLDVAMIRMNHNGTRMDTPNQRDSWERGDVNEVVGHVKKIRAQGAGIISMKLCGEGQFTKFEDRDAAIQFAFDTAGVDSVTIGYKNTAEIDEAIERMSRVLNG